jgi:hypothetical protein
MRYFFSCRFVSGVRVREGARGEKWGDRGGGEKRSERDSPILHPDISCTLPLSSILLPKSLYLVKFLILLGLWILFF